MERFGSRAFRWLAVGVSLVASTAHAGLNEWTNIGPAGGTVAAVAIDPILPATVYVANPAGLFKTRDGGASWEPISGGLLGGPVSALAVTPFVLLAKVGGTLYRSLDRGASWSIVGLEGRAVSAIAVGGTFSQYMYVGGGITFYDALGCHLSGTTPCGGVVIRGSSHGEFTGSPGNYHPGLPGAPTVLAVGVGGVWAGFSPSGGIWNGSAGGWRARDVGLPVGPVTALALSSSGSKYAVAGDNPRVYRLDDGVVAWTEASTGLPAFPKALAAAPASPSTVYAGTATGVFRTEDEGETWTPFGLEGVAVSVLGIDPKDPQTIYAGTSEGLFRATFGSPLPCVSRPTVMCLNEGRFGVEAIWRTLDGRSGQATAVPVTADTGYFWFRTPTDVEVAVKVVDGTSVNGHYWVFAGALSDVEYTILVTDSLTGDVRAYANPQGRLSSFAATAAFPASGAAAPAIGDEAAPISATAYLGGTTACESGPATLCVHGNRFRVAVAWSTEDGRSGSGQAVSLTSDTGSFWFFNDANLELVVKVLDGRPINGHFWVFYGALSNVAYTITVTDTETGIVKTYENPQRHLASVADTKAF